MSTLATRLERIEEQTNDTARHARVMRQAIRDLVNGEPAAVENLRTARDQLAVIAGQYDTFAQYWLNAAAVMLGESEVPKHSEIEH